MITDRKGLIRYVNPKFFLQTGYTPDEVLGKTPGFLSSGDSTQETYKTLWNSILQGNEWRGEFCNKKKSGELFWESVVICPIFDESNQITHFAAIKEDITERRTLESELRQAQKLEGIGQLAAGIAHDHLIIAGVGGQRVGQRIGAGVGAVQGGAIEQPLVGRRRVCINTHG